MDILIEILIFDKHGVKAENRFSAFKKDEFIVIIFIWT